MTSRRSFFKSLALLGAAAAGCPGIFIPKFEPVTWRRLTPTKRFVPNPAYFRTEFEWFVWDKLPVYDQRILRAMEVGGGVDRYPVRYNICDAWGHPIPVLPFIEGS